MAKATTTAKTQRSGDTSLPLDRVPLQRARHAVPAAAALAELEALDLEHLDPRLPHLGDGVGVPLVGDDDARLEGDDVVAVVPLLPLLLVLVTTGPDHGQLADPQRIGHGAEERGLDGHVEVALLAARPEADGPD